MKGSVGGPDSDQRTNLRWRFDFRGRSPVGIFDLRRP